MQNVAITFVGKSKKDVIKELKTIPAGSLVDFTGFDGADSTDVLVEDIIAELEKSIEVNKDKKPIVMDDQFNNPAGWATPAEIAKMVLPREERVRCLINSVTPLLEKNERIFKIVKYTKEDGTEDSLVVNKDFLIANDGQNDKMLQKDAYLELTLQHTIANKTQYLERRKGHENEGKIVFHKENAKGEKEGKSLSNISPISGKQIELIDTQFAAKNAMVMNKAKMDFIKNMGKELETYANNPVMFAAMTKLFESQLTSMK